MKKKRVDKKISNTDFVNSDDGSISVGSEIIAALVALGYSTNEARQAVQASDLTTISTVEDGIRQAFMHFSN